MRKIDYTTYKKPSDFVRFEQGDTTIRIISNGVMAKKHGMKTAKGFVPLGDCTETPECEQCLKGNEAKLKWLWIAIARPDNEAKILDVGPMVGDAICKIAQEKKQDPQEYDLVINKIGTGFKTKYTTRALPAKPLTEEEKKLTSNAKQFLVNKYFKK